MKLNTLIILVLVPAIFLSIVITDNIEKSSVWENVFIGLTSSLLVVLLLEIVNGFYNRNILSKMAGTYKRIKITTVTTQTQPNGIYDDLTEEYNIKNVNSEITLSYKGEGEYIGKANYFEGEVEFKINLNKINPKIGSGIYQYKNKEYPDLGIYTIQVDINCINKIFVSYSNVIPSGLAKGYEIWEKEY